MSEIDVRRLPIDVVRQLPPGLYVITPEQLRELGYVDPTNCLDEVCVAAREGRRVMGPPHYASSNCESGKRSHCSCDTCF